MNPDKFNRWLLKLVVRTPDREIHQFNSTITLCNDNRVGFYWDIQVPDNYFDYEEGEE